MTAEHVETDQSRLDVTHSQRHTSDRNGGSVYDRSGAECALTGDQQEVLGTSERLDIAYQEYCQRIQAGETVNIDDFCNRFPGVESLVRRQLEVHAAIHDRVSWLLGSREMMWARAGDQIMGFTLLEEIGAGAFARVFRASDDNLGGREVAVKICRAGSHEAWILGRLKHENIVPVHSIQYDPELGLSLICMPYLGRVTLRDIIASTWNTVEMLTRASIVAGSATAAHARGTTERLPSVRTRETSVDGVVSIGCLLAEALAYAHCEGVLHLDLKPSNVLMDESGHPRLLDFNLASHRNRGIPRVGGTLAYMAPEQARCFLDGSDGSQLDGRCDIFSLGVILYEMLCGALPHGAVPEAVSSRAGVKHMMERQLRDNAPSWAERTVDPGIRAIVERCLAIDAQKRYQSAGALAHDLRREASLLRRSRRWIRRHRRLVMGGVGVLILLGTGLAVGMASREPYPVRQFEEGQACLVAGHYDRAIDHLTRSITADPGQPAALHARAQALVAAERYHEAIRDLDAACKLCEDGRQYALLAYCHNIVQSHAEAIVFYEKSLQLGNGSTAVFNNLGFSYYLRGCHKDSIKAMNVAVGNGDSLSTTLENRAVVYQAIAAMKGREPTEAISDIGMLMSLSYGSARAYYHAAAIYGQASSFDPSWKPQARRYAKLALQHGAPLESIKSDPFLSLLLDDHDLNRPINERDSAEQFAMKSYFLRPQE